MMLQHTLLKPDWILLRVALFHAERISQHQCVYMHTNGTKIVR